MPVMVGNLLARRHWPIAAILIALFKCSPSVRVPTTIGRCGFIERGPLRGAFITVEPTVVRRSATRSQSRGQAARRRHTARSCGTHRGTAFHFSPGHIGKPWRSFTVEQQGAIVQSWFMAERDRFARVAPGRRLVTHYGLGVFEGDRSEYDLRFPYIRDVIRARNRRADYVPLTPVKGSDAQVRAMPDKLVALGYLQARHADGTVCQSRSATLDALDEFQKRNGLKADRDFGGQNSLTRSRLDQPFDTLVRWR